MMYIILALQPDDVNKNDANTLLVMKPPGFSSDLLGTKYNVYDKIKDMKWIWHICSRGGIYGWIYTLWDGT